MSNGDHLRFVPRHRDEILVDIGDPVYVHVEAEDGWCEGINLRTGEKGIFPLAHVVDVEYNDFDPAGVEEKKERYLLDYLGSVACAMKGVEIIVQSVIKMTQGRQGEAGGQRTPCILEISDKGIKMVDKSKPGVGLSSSFSGVSNLNSYSRMAMEFQAMNTSTT